MVSVCFMLFTMFLRHFLIVLDYCDSELALLDPFCLLCVGLLGLALSQD